MADLHVHLLGEFSLALGDELLTAVHHPRRQALLAYLLLHRNTPQLRQHLAFLFWPDTSEAQALTNLRNLLFKLRQDLPDPDRFLLIEKQTVQWRPGAPFTLDVAAFEAAATLATTIADLERGALLYRGDLLPSCYDDWILPHRARLQQMALNLLERLIGRLEDRRELHVAIAYAKQLRQLDPLNEATCRTLIRLYAADDDRAGGLRVYHSFVTELQSELGVAPSVTTQAAFRRLLSTEGAPPSADWATLDQPPLVGRQTEWKGLHDAWRAAAGGKPHLLLLAGEAGAGKTRLAEELLAWIVRQGLAGAAAYCYAAEGALTYAPIAAWLRAPALQKRLTALDTQVLTEVARLAPDLLAERPDVPRPEQLTAKWQRQRLFDALARVMCVQEEPLMLLLDDAQWCDRDTLEWVHYLLRFDRKARLLVLATMRTEDVTPDHPLNTLAASVRQSGQLTELALGPLSAAETTLLADHMAKQTLTPTQHAWLHQESEGNPLFVVEMVRAGWDMGNKEPPAQFRPLPPKVHAVLHARIAQLSAGAREVAELAAAIGREFSFPVLAHALDQAENALVYSLDELWQRRIIREQGTAAYDFTHDKLREVVYASLSAARRHLLHRRIAQAMGIVYAHTPDAVCGLVARQYELAGYDQQAIPYYQRAAQVAQKVYANDDAIRYDQHALALLAGPATGESALAAELYEHLGDLLHFSGQYEEARDALQRAAAFVPQADWIGRALLQRKIGNTWREQYDYAGALTCYVGSERILEQAPTKKSAAWWEAWIRTSLETSLVYYWQGHVAKSDQLLRKLQPVVELHGAAAQRAAYFQAIVLMEFRRNRSVATDDNVTQSMKALAAQIEAGNQADIPAAHFNVGFNLLWNGRPEAALEPLMTALKLAEQSGDVSLQARSLTYLTVAYRRCGQSEETRRHAGRSLNVARAAHMPEYMAMAKANQAWLAWQAGDLAQTEELGDAALALWQQLPDGHASTPFQWTALWPLLAATLSNQEAKLAVEHARRLLDPRQQPLPGSLVTLLEQAVEAWKQDEAEAVSLLHHAVVKAQQLHFL